MTKEAFFMDKKFYQCIMLDVAECMVGGGHAFAWGSLHYKAQEHARENSLGLWAEARWQERPWLFRRRNRTYANVVARNSW